MSAAKIPRRLTDLRDVDIDTLQAGDVLSWDGDEVTGEPPGAAQNAPLAFEQPAPLDEWVINHNLGYRPAAVMVVDSTGQAVLGEIIQSTDDTLIVKFHNPFSGTVYIR